MTHFRRSKEAAAAAAAATGRCKPTVGCKKHPKHHQSPGVCSLCLREKLSHLSTSSSRSIAKTKMESFSSSSSLSSNYSSCSSASSCSSPVYRYDRRYASGKGSLSSLFLIGSGNNRLLTKSRTVAFVPRIMRGNKDGDAKKNKAGFLLNKLFRSKRKEEGSVHAL
ncbi:hypothetical protein SLA2020_294900 [Shorea laevis]